MNAFVIKGAQVINEGRTQVQDVYIKNGKIEAIGAQLDKGVQEINADGLLLMPGVIDDQVHFREPGLTHKAEIATESRAAVAGGTTTFMEMPNTKPTSTTQEILQEKYDRAAQVSPANYSFFMGATNDNIDEVLRTNPKDVCGIKVFMGSSTGNMLVDARDTLEGIFSQSPMLIATHCEDEATVRANTQKALDHYGENIPIDQHPIIRNEEACYLSSSMAIELAKKHDARLHILHISTADELALFRNDIPMSEKRISAEVCVHHLWFSADDYATRGTQIKCNPAVKAAHHREALWEGLLSDKLDIIATDHAPHTWAEKQNTYMNAPSGVPLVQHSLLMMFEAVKQGRMSQEKLVEKMCHAPADCFHIDQRGYVKEGYWADLVLVDPNTPYQVSKKNLEYKCGWSPFEGAQFKHSVHSTFVNGQCVYSEGKVHEVLAGQRVTFNR